jgi:hypothetical protein
MSDLQSNMLKGLLAAVCSALAMLAGAASARQEARAAQVDPRPNAPVSSGLF